MQRSTTGWPDERWRHQILWVDEAPRSTGANATRQRRGPPSIHGRERPEADRAHLGALAGSGPERHASEADAIEVRRCS